MFLLFQSLSTNSRTSFFRVDSQCLEVAEENEGSFRVGRGRRRGLNGFSLSNQYLKQARVQELGWRRVETLKRKGGGENDK